MSNVRYITFDHAALERLAYELSTAFEAPSLRDRFALAAMQGWLASFGAVPHPADDPTTRQADQIAVLSYRMADAMLAVRAQPVHQGARQL